MPVQLGEFVCYFPIDADIPASVEQTGILDEMNRFRSPELQNAILAANLITGSQWSESIDLIGVGYWGSDYPASDPPDDAQKDKYCKLYAADFAAAMDIYERELFDHWSEITNELDQTPEELADLVEVYDISLESRYFAGIQQMNIGLIMGIDVPYPIGERLEAFSTSQSASKVQKIQSWVRSHRDEILASMIAGATVDAAQYFLDDGRDSEHELPTSTDSLRIEDEVDDGPSW